MRLAFAAVFSMAFVVGAPAYAKSPPGDPSSHSYYRSSDGSKVHGPTKASENVNEKYGKSTAACRDGAQSYSHHASGTCSGHGGVEHWE